MPGREDRIVILSTCVFTATGVVSFDGFAATEANRIIAVGPRKDAGRYVASATRVIDAGNRTVAPGMTDCARFEVHIDGVK